MPEGLYNDCFHQLWSNRNLFNTSNSNLSFQVCWIWKTICCPVYMIWIDILINMRIGSMIFCSVNAFFLSLVCLELSSLLACVFLKLQCSEILFLIYENIWVSLDYKMCDSIIFDLSSEFLSPTMSNSRELSEYLHKFPVPTIHAVEVVFKGPTDCPLGQVEPFAWIYLYFIYNDRSAQQFCIQCILLKTVLIYCFTNCTTDIHIFLILNLPVMVFQNLLGFSVPADFQRLASSTQNAL